MANAISSNFTDNGPVESVCFNIEKEGGGFFYDEYAVTDPKTGASYGTVWANRYFSGYNPLNPFNWATKYTFLDTEGNEQMRLVKNYGILNFDLDALTAAIWGIFSNSAAKSSDFFAYTHTNREAGYIDGRLVSFGTRFDITDPEGKQVANIRIPKNKEAANIYAERGDGKIGSIKADDETRELGDVKVTVQKGACDDRILAILSAHFLRYNLLDLSPGRHIQIHHKA